MRRVHQSSGVRHRRVLLFCTNGNDSSGAIMKVASIALAILAMAIPGGALAQVQDRIEVPVTVGNSGDQFALGSADLDIAVEDNDAIRLGTVGITKAAVVIDRR